MTQFMNKLVHSNVEPFDILFRNFFESDAFFMPAIESKPKYPINIYETDEALHFDIAVVGLDESDLKIEVKDGNTLTVTYDKEIEKKESSEISRNYIHKGIAERAFSLGWKIGNKFDLDQIEASVNKGLLNINIPIAPDKKPKLISFTKNKK